MTERNCYRQVIESGSRFVYLVMLLMSLAVRGEAANCTNYPFKIAELRARVSKPLLAKGVAYAEVYDEIDAKSSKKLSFDPSVKRVLVAKADVGHDEHFVLADLAPGLYWVVLAPSEYHFAVRIQKQAVKDVELQIDEERGCTIVDFQFLK